MASLIDYPALAIKVQRVIEGTGRDVNFIRNSKTPTDPAKPWRSYSTALPGAAGEPGSSVTAKAVADMENVEELEENFNIRHGDIFYYVSTLSLGASVDLKEYDAVIDDGKRYEIVKAEPIKPGAVNLLFIVQARR